ncbi:hypothetical protein G9A89_021714 [Geosiphon pyriformis]|nr:hypothetical protein G9A89_021714 [Geosiphon pyriformis]
MADEESIDTSQFEQESWYTDALEFWSDKPATVGGMLGGYDAISNLDIKTSQIFLSEYVKGKRGKGNALKTPPRILTKHACDCGAGIGRISKHFLLKIFDKVDLVECTPKFIEHAEKEYLLNEKNEGKIDKFYCVGLQEFDPEPQKYDLIWCQWVLLYLKDEDLVSFLKRAKNGLKQNGIICLKENVSVFGYSFHEDDSSVTRSDKIFKEIFQNSRLKLLKEATQYGFPEGLFEVKMYALAPDV